MTSVASGASPHLGYEFGAQGDPSTNGSGDLSDEQNAWTIINHPASAGPSTTSFFNSPANSMGSSWAFVGANGQMQPSPSATALSPLNLDFSDQGSYHQSPVCGGQSVANSFAGANGQFLADLAATSGSDFLPPSALVFDEQQFHELSPYLNTFPPLSGLDQMAVMGAPAPTATTANSFHLPQQAQQPLSEASWEEPSSNGGQSPVFVMDDFANLKSNYMHRISTPSPTAHDVSPLHSPPASANGGGASSPASPGVIKKENSPAPISIRKVRDSSARVQKRRQDTGSSISSSGSGKFLIVTPDSVNAHAGKPNPWECFEAMRPSQRGRKGPLANDTKMNALQVRRLGACFCCHARKVKCDKERPCRNCTKLTVAVPQAVCWQFQDFLPVLFPDFLRAHLRKEELARFVADNIEAFAVDGADKACVVELFSGARFAATLTIAAKFFTAKKAEVLQHWHLGPGRGGAALHARGSVPIGLELEGASAQREELRKKAKAYIAAMTQEPAYADQVTDSLRHTMLPRQVLRIVQHYSFRCEHPLVKRALSIYAMHYAMTRHLCLTRQSIVSLAATRLVPQNEAWVTPRLLNRQLKSVIDEMLLRETQLLFEGFSKSLKPKSRKEWAPCLAAFLVLCLFMETVESAAEGFVVGENELLARQGRERRWKRQFALDVNKEIENMPFRQFAYQFHQIYQTHSRDASTRAFNPLFDDSCFEQAGLDRFAAEMVWQLRRLVQDRESWMELDFLTASPFVAGQEESTTYPGDVSHNYAGRLLSKFLLSFTDDRYIWAP